MSDDLISRSALVKEIENMKVPISMPRVLDIISEQPTAYDVEEKIELIKKSKKRYTREILSNKTSIYEKALDIVRSHADWVIENPTTNSDDDYARVCLGAISGICLFVDELMKEQTEDNNG